MRFPGSFDSRSGWIPYGGAGRQEFVDSGKGEIALVRIRTKGSKPEIEPVETSHFIWQEEKWELSSEEDLARLIQEVATRPDFDRRLLRLELTGTLNADAMLRLDELREILTNRYFFGEFEDAHLHVQPTEEEVREVAAQGVLARVLELLDQEVSDPDPSIRQIAERAILVLYQIARETK
jgi:hypothetical protein